MQNFPFYLAPSVVETSGLSADINNLLSGQGVSSLLSGQGLFRAQTPSAGSSNNAFSIDNILAPRPLQFPVSSSSQSFITPITTFFPFSSAAIASLPRDLLGK